MSSVTESGDLPSSVTESGDVPSSVTGAGDLPSSVTGSGDILSAAASGLLHHKQVKAARSDEVISLADFCDVPEHLPKCSHILHLHAIPLLQAFPHAGQIQGFLVDGMIWWKKE